VADLSKYIPTGDKVLIKPDPKQDKTPGGLYKPQTGFADLVWGEVVSVSEGFHSQNGDWIELRFKPGDRVCYQEGQAVELDFLPGHALLSQATIVLKEKEGLTDGHGSGQTKDEEAEG